MLTIFVELPFGNIKKLLFNNKRVAPAPVPTVDMNMNEVSEKDLQKEANRLLQNGNGSLQNGSAKKDN